MCPGNFHTHQHCGGILSQQTYVKRTWPSRCFFHNWMRTVWVPYLKADFHFNYTLFCWMLLACFCAVYSHSSMWALSLIFFAYFVDMHNRPCQKRLLVVWYQINSLKGFLFFFVSVLFHATVNHWFNITHLSAETNKFYQTPSVTIYDMIFWTLWILTPACL